MENLKDFLLHEVPAEEEETKKKKTAKKATVEYSTVFASGPDFGIRRKTRTTSSVFVFIVSADQIYIKNERTGEIKNMLVEDDIIRFFNALPEEGYKFDKELCPNFFDTIERGRKFAEKLLRVSRSHTYKEFVKKGFIFTNTLPESINNNSWEPEAKTEVRSYVSQVSEVFKVLKEVLGHEDAVKAFTRYFHPSYRNNPEGVSSIFRYTEDQALSGVRYPLTNGQIAERLSAFNILEDRYGLDGARRYIRNLLQGPSQLFIQPNSVLESFFVYEQRRWSYMRNDPPVQAVPRTYALDRYIDYTIYQSHAEGFTSKSDIGDFMSSWKDDLAMQVLVYGKIIDKYPDNLLSHHLKMSAKTNALKQMIDEENWAKAVEKMKPYEYSKGQFAIIAPRTRQDMIDEAQMQSNCLASYVSHVADGICMIFFLRKKDDPERSYVTIELRSDMSLGQVKARFNREPDDAAKEFVHKWHNEIVVPRARKIA